MSGGLPASPARATLPDLEARPPPWAYALVPLVYWISAALGSRLVVTEDGLSLLWPPNAILLAAFIRYRGRGWAAFAVGGVLAEIAGDLHRFTLVEALVFGGANVLETTVAWLLLARWGFDPRFRHVVQVWRFVLAGPIIGALVGAITGAAALRLLDGAGRSVLDTAQVWWFGDAMGLLILTPLYLGLWLGDVSVLTPRRPPVKAADLLVALGCLALLVLFGTATRGVIGGVHLRPILLLPFVLYAAARLPLTGASLVVAAVSLSFVGLTVLGRGPYGHESPDVAALLTQEFVFVAGIAALGLSAFLTDLEGRDTETRAVNAELRQKQLALEQSNAELRRIAFVAAHDLQTPLRSICRFSQLLAVECAGKLGPDADDWIRRVTAGTTRLEALLRDLGTLAEIDAGDAPRTPVAMGPLVDEVVRELRGILEETGATIRHTSLPVVEGDVEQLARLLKELCCNAIKHRSASPPEILVSAREEADGWAFAVRDNGRGIPRQEQEKVFDLFYRPGSARDTPGTGLGLALCARIVHRHGGRIWVESQPGEGSTFHFTLRRSESA